MNFVTRQQVNERTERGWCESSIYAPCAKRQQMATDISERIANAFRNVRLGDGIGLFEGQAIDDYETEAVRLAQRKKDEKEEWQATSSNDLNSCSSSLCFFDPRGMRFHLPAFLCCELRGQYRMSDLEYSLVHSASKDYSDWRKERYSLFSPDEKGAVANYLEFYLDDIDAEFSRDAIEDALVGFWWGSE